MERWCHPSFPGVALCLFQDESAVVRQGPEGSASPRWVFGAKWLCASVQPDDSHAHWIPGSSVAGSKTCADWWMMHFTDQTVQKAVQRHGPTAVAR